MVNMKVLASREEWLKARTKIGGSDAAAIVGLNPYKSNTELWNEKANGAEPEDISDKPYVRYGIEAEKYLRELFKLDYPMYRMHILPKSALFLHKVIYVILNLRALYLVMLRLQIHITVK